MAAQIIKRLAFIAIAVLLLPGALSVVGFKISWNCPTKKADGEAITCADITGYQVAMKPPKSVQSQFLVPGNQQFVSVVMPRQHGNYVAFAVACIDEACGSTATKDYFLNNLQPPTNGAIDAPTNGSID